MLPSTEAVPRRSTVSLAAIVPVTAPKIVTALATMSARI